MLEAFLKNIDPALKRAGMERKRAVLYDGELHELVIKSEHEPFTTDIPTIYLAPNIPQDYSEPNVQGFNLYEEQYQFFVKRNEFHCSRDEQLEWMLPLVVEELPPKEFAQNFVRRFLAYEEPKDSQKPYKRPHILEALVQWGGYPLIRNYFVKRHTNDEIPNKH